MDEQLRGEDSGPWWGDGGVLSPPRARGPQERGAGLPGRGAGSMGNGLSSPGGEGFSPRFAPCGTCFFCSEPDAGMKFGEKGVTGWLGLEILFPL